MATKGVIADVGVPSPLYQEYLFRNLNAVRNIKCLCSVSRHIQAQVITGERGMGSDRIYDELLQIED